MQVPKHAISPINAQILFRNSPLFRESLSQASKYGITRVCHLQSENGAHWDSIFRCKYAIFLVFTGLENF